MLNKKLTIAAIIIAAFVANSANAAEFNLGGELSLMNKTRHSRLIRDNRLGANIFAGTRFNQNFGAELGLGYIAKRNNRNPQTGIGATRNIYADALAFIPLDNKVELIAAAGVGRARFTNSYRHHAWRSGKSGLRLGAGAQYNVNANWGVRTMVRTQLHSGLYNGTNTSVTLGGVYTFK